MQPEENKWLVVHQPLQPPAIDPHLEELNAVVRSTECLRHFVLSIEFWISPGGQLRQWVRLNVCVAAFLLIPAVVLMPIIGLVLHEVDGCLAMLARIAWKLILLSILIFVAVCVFKHRQKQFRSSSKGSSNTRHRKRRKPPFGGIAF